MHQVGHGFLGWERLVDELEWVVQELLVALEVVLLVIQELVDLGQPAAVQGFSLLNAMN